VPLVIMTGASGSGKTAIARAIEQDHHSITVFRFDTIGVPSAEVMATFTCAAVCAMDWKWRAGGGMAQVRCRSGGQVASVDEESSPPAQCPAMMGLIVEQRRSFGHRVRRPDQGRIDRAAICATSRSFRAHLTAVVQTLQLLR
jgi:hypothetical protein